MEINKLQNQSDFPGNPKPTIVISVNDTQWNDAYKNWLAGKNPTDSKEWKMVFACFTERNQNVKKFAKNR